MSEDEHVPAVSRPLWLGKSLRSSASAVDIKAAAAEMEQDPSYEKNGWTPEALATYFKERTEAEANSVLHRRPVKPTRTKGWHNGHRWRR